MTSYNIDMKQTVQQSQIRQIEQDFIKRVNRDIAGKVTPIYNMFLLVSSAFFAYFIVTEGNQCFAKGHTVSGVEFEGSEDVTKQFYLLSNCGLILLLVSVLMYYLQSKDGMFDLMRPYVIITNLLTLAWFTCLQYYRFKPEGRACSGDYLTSTPKNYNTIYLGNQGQFLLYYIGAHYTIYIIQKIASICITNKHEMEFEKKKSLITNKV